MSSNVKMDWDFSDITNKFDNMGKDLTALEKIVTSKVAKVIKLAIQNNLLRSSKDKNQYDRNVDYKHMKDDIKISSLKEDKESLDSIREIKGGKQTHFKWKWLENGTSKMKPNHFLTKSMNQTKDEVKSIFNEAIKKALRL